VTEGADRDAEAVEEYWQTLRSAQSDEIVAEAEDVLASAWAVELEEVRRATLRAAACARTAYAAARTLVRVKRTEGSQRDLAQAHHELEKAEAEQQRSLDAANALLAAVDEEFELICLAAEEREAVSQTNRILVRSAWKAAYGAADTSDGCPEAGDRDRDEDEAGESGGTDPDRQRPAEGGDGLFWVEGPEDP
jgi:hypothetical protein